MRHELEISIFDLDLSSRSQYELPRSCWISLESLGKDKHIGIFEFVLELFFINFDKFLQVQLLRLRSHYKPETCHGDPDPTIRTRSQSLTSHKVQGRPPRSGSPLTSQLPADLRSANIERRSVSGEPIPSLHALCHSTLSERFQRSTN